MQGTAGWSPHNTRREEDRGEAPAQRGVNRKSALMGTPLPHDHTSAGRMRGRGILEGFMGIIFTIV